MFGIEISEQAHDIMTWLGILGYPLLSWLWYRVGFGDGCRVTLDYLEKQGLLEFEPEDAERKKK
jgi:hypothetical protein